MMPITESIWFLQNEFTGYYTKEECHIDLIKLCNFGNVRFIHAEVCGINTTTKQIFCVDDRPPLSYDVLSIDIGISPKPISSNSLYYEKNDRFQQDLLTAVKPIDKFASKWADITARYSSFSGEHILHIVVIGGGAGGVELCFSVHHRLMELLKSNGLDESYLKISIVTRSKTLLPDHNRF